MEGEEGVEADHGHGEAGGGHQREAPHLLTRHPRHLGRPRIPRHGLWRQEAVGEEVLTVPAELLLLLLLLRHVSAMKLSNCLW